jgi:hypothetical protein
MPRAVARLLMQSKVDVLREEGKKKNYAKIHC